MSGITLVFGRNAAGDMIPLLLSDTGFIIGSVDVLTMPSIPAGTNLIGDVQSRNLGYIGGAWQKNALGLNYGGAVEVDTSNTSLAAGTNTLNAPAVPANRVWVLNHIAMSYVGTVATVALYVMIIDGSTTIRLFSQPSGVISDMYYNRQGGFILKAGANLRMVILNATLNDDAFLAASGYYFDVNL